MANVYAVKTGNWSDTTVWNTGALPTSADDVYSNNFTVTIDQNITVLSIRNTAASPAVAGGGFLLTGTFTINATSAAGLTAGATTLLTYTGFNSIINAIINGSSTTNVNTINHNSTGTLTINGNILNTVNTSVDVITTNSTGTLNINGTINKTGRGNNVVVASVCTVNIVGDILMGSNFSGGATLAVNANATVNITGNLSNNAASTGASNSITLNINASSCIVNITGNVDFNGLAAGCHTINFNNTGRVNITGNISRTATNTTASYAVNSSVAGFLTIIGNIFAGPLPAVVSTNTSAINLFSGPFICSTYGIIPFSVTRMNYIITPNSYFEFRDSSTNGALPPSAAAPATKLVAPDTVVDAPAASNVRFGVTYALGTQTGTLRVPSPNSVAFGVLTDNTTGTAVLTPQAVWDYATSSLTTAGSIGERLKNASTVDTTGDQLAALL